MEFKELDTWFNVDILSLNIDKACYMLFSDNLNTNIKLCINSNYVKKIDEHFFPQVFIDDKLSWKQCFIHIQ